MLLKEVKNLPKETQEKEEIKKLKEILERTIKEKIAPMGLNW